MLAFIKARLHNLSVIRQLTSPILQFYFLQTRKSRIRACAAGCFWNFIAHMKTKYALCLALLLTGHATFAQDWAKAMLEKSPRHGEWVEVKNGSRAVRCFIVYPEVKNAATAVIAIHEIFGLSDWVRETADELAAAGYIAIAPDLLSGAGPNGGGSSAFSSQDDVRTAIFKLPPDQITGDLNAVAEYVRTLPSANGKLAVTGFCWGGTQTFRYACNRPDLKAALVFYGTGPTSAAEISKIQCPVYGFYGGNDNRVSSTIPASERLMKAAGKTYEPAIYEGAGHGFMRAGEQPDAQDANKKARADSWERLKNLLGKL
jgi:carboxymethylenebutenolidase